MAKEVWSWVKTLLLAVSIAAVLLNNPVFATYRVDGNSMSPTLENGQVVILSKGKTLQHGDVIVFEEPDPAYRKTFNSNLVKRIIALPGDTVLVDQGQVYVNGLPIFEEYVDTTITGSWRPVYIEEGWVFVLGDNRHPGASRDSRVFGPVQVESLVGKVYLILFPWPTRVE
jgi:signal peptidase I